MTNTKKPPAKNSTKVVLGIKRAVDDVIILPPPVVKPPVVPEPEPTPVPPTDKKKPRSVIASGRVWLAEKVCSVLLPVNTAIVKTEHEEVMTIDGAHLKETK